MPLSFSGGRPVVRCSLFPCERICGHRKRVHEFQVLLFSGFRDKRGKESSKQPVVMVLEVMIAFPDPGLDSDIRIPLHWERRKESRGRQQDRVQTEREKGHPEGILKERKSTSCGFRLVMATLAYPN